MRLQENLKARGINHEFQFVAGLSLITFVRNYFANRVAFDSDKDGLEFTHLLFIDCDNSNFEDYVPSMLIANTPITCLPYCFKSVNWSNVADVVKKGAPPEHLPELCGGDPVWNAPGQIPINEVVRVPSTGTGMMLIKREVFRALADAHPEWKFRPKSMRGLEVPKREFSYEFFQMKVNPKTLNYQPEDFFFCEAASELGFGTWAFPMARNCSYWQFRLRFESSGRTRVGA